MEISGLPNSATVGSKDASNTSTEAATKSLADNFDTFLSLLTTQLKNQDPLDPLDANQFTEQLVQFANVEQAIHTNKKLDQLIALQSSSQLNAAVAYLGHEVKVSGDLFALQNSVANLEYDLPSNASQAVLTIVNSAGLPIRTVPADSAAGVHQYVWDGRDNNGAQMPDGIYRFVLTAAGGSGEAIQATTSMLGRVTGVKSIDQEMMLSIGPLDVPFDNVLAVRDPASGP